MGVVDVGLDVEVVWLVERDDERVERAVRREPIDYMLRINKLAEVVGPGFERLLLLVARPEYVAGRYLK